jgi:hypothetical protein
VHKLLVDTASSEFLFCLDFWDDETVFKELFSPVVAVVEGDLAQAVQVSDLAPTVSWKAQLAAMYMQPWQLLVTQHSYPHTES